MENEKIADFLSDQRDAAPDDLQHYFLSFEDYWERKLWHELTDILVQFYNEKESASQRIPLYNNFIKSFADKINQLKLVQIGLSTASQCEGTIYYYITSDGTIAKCDDVQMTRTASLSSQLSPRVSTSLHPKTPTFSP